MASPQPAQQPIYPYDLNLALDRVYNRVTSYFDARFDKVMTEIRVLQAGIAEIKETQQQQNNRMTNIEAFQLSMMDASKAQTTDLLQLMRDLHAEAMEGINELRQKGRNKPSPSRILIGYQECGESGEKRLKFNHE